MAKRACGSACIDDETSEVCQWLIPETHTFEQWDDAPAYDGTMTIMQPLIAPLYGGKSAHDLLTAFTETPEKSTYETLRDYWRTKHTGADYDTWWNHSVHDGFIKDSALSPVTAAAKPVAPMAAASSGGGADTYEISFHSDPYVLDGRYANNAWLQELPRPVTRLTWDNAVLLSEKTARDLGVTDEDRVEITVNGASCEGVRSGAWRGSPMASIAAEHRIRPATLGARGQRRGVRRLSDPLVGEPALHAGREGREDGRAVPARRGAASFHDGRPRAGEERIAGGISRKIRHLRRRKAKSRRRAWRFSRRCGSTRAMRGAWRSI